MKTLRHLALLFLAVTLFASKGWAASLPSVLIINPSDQAGTFSVAVPLFLEKDLVKKGSGVQPVVRGKKVAAQNDWLATYPDGGSVSHVTATFPIYLAAREKVNVSFVNEQPIKPPKFHTPNLVDELELKVEVKDQDGTHRLSLGRDQIIALLKNVQFNLAGARPLWGELGGKRDEEYVRERQWTFEVGPNCLVSVFWRIFSAASGVNGAAYTYVTVENTRGDRGPDAMEVTSASVKVGGKPITSLSAHTLTKGTLYAAETWVANNGKTVPYLLTRQDHKSLARAGIYYLVDAANRLNEKQITDWMNYQASSKLNCDWDPAKSLGIENNCGIIYRDQDNTGDRIDLGYYPRWTYTAFNSHELVGAYATQAQDANGNGAFPLHLQKFDKNLNRWVPGAYWYDSAWKNRGKNGNHPDPQHAPFLGYPSYILTGNPLFARLGADWTLWFFNERSYYQGRQSVGGRAKANYDKFANAAAAYLPDDCPWKWEALRLLHESAQLQDDRFDFNGPFGNSWIGTHFMASSKPYTMHVRSAFDGPWGAQMGALAGYLHNIPEYTAMADHAYEWPRNALYVHVGDTATINGDKVTYDIKDAPAYREPVGISHKLIKNSEGNCEFEEGTVQYLLDYSKGNFAFHTWAKKIEEDYNYEWNKCDLIEKYGSDVTKYKPIGGWSNPWRSPWFEYEFARYNGPCFYTYHDKKFGTYPDAQKWVKNIAPFVDEERENLPRGFRQIPDCSDL